MADSSGGGVSPGGPRISSIKKRRLASLQQNMSSGGGSTQQRSSAAPLRQASTGTQSSGGNGSRTGGSRGGKSARSGSAGGEQPPAAASQQQQAPNQQGGGRWDPPYQRLDEAVATGPAAEAQGLPPPEPGSQVVASLLEALMATNPRAFDARQAIGLKLQDRTVMLENPAGQRRPPPARHKPSKAAARLAAEVQQRRQALNQLRTAGLTYQAAQPVHRSWQQYLREVLAAAGPQGLEAALYAADLHGCSMRVAATPDARYRGLEGIVVRDTANTLQLVTPDDRFVVVPKKLCTWEFDADRRRVVTLLGPGLARRGGAGAGAAAAPRPKTLREAIRGQQRS